MKLRRDVLVFLLFLGAQVLFWQQTHTIRPDLTIVPTPPGVTAVHALTLGDDEFYFRALALHLQNMGDTFGRFTALRYYDYSKLYAWFALLDTLDDRSDTLPFLASYYYSQTQNTPDVRYMVDYLYTHSTRDVGKHWWWLLQGMYLAMHKLNDMELAVKVASPMVNPAVPVWAQQMVAVVHEKRGEMDDALRIMETIQQNSSSLSDMDLKYMTYFIEERLNKLRNDRSAP